MDPFRIGHKLASPDCVQDLNVGLQALTAPKLRVARGEAPCRHVSG